LIPGSKPRWRRLPASCRRCCPRRSRPPGVLRRVLHKLVNDQYYDALLSPVLTIFFAKNTFLVQHRPLLGVREYLRRVFFKNVYLGANFSVARAELSANIA
jgi:hypothetical protein